MSGNDLYCRKCKSHHHPVECPKEAQDLRTKKLSEFKRRGSMKLGQIKNNGVFKKEPTKYYDDSDMRIGQILSIRSEGSNQAKTELSEVELKVDEEKIEKVIWQTINKEFQYVSNPQIIECAIALSSSMSEWLRLEGE